jgi:hypothetical protein
LTKENFLGYEELNSQELKELKELEKEENISINEMISKL